MDLISISDQQSFGALVHLRFWRSGTLWRIGAFGTMAHFGALAHFCTLAHFGALTHFGAVTHGRSIRVGLDEIDGCRVESLRGHSI